MVFPGSKIRHNLSRQGIENCAGFGYKDHAYLTLKGGRAESGNGIFSKTKDNLYRKIISLSYSPTEAEKRWTNVQLILHPDTISMVDVNLDRVNPDIYFDYIKQISEDDVGMLQLTYLLTGGNMEKARNNEHFREVLISAAVLYLNQPNANPQHLKGIIPLFTLEERLYLLNEIKSAYERRDVNNQVPAFTLLKDFYIGLDKPQLKEMRTAMHLLFKERYEGVVDYLEDYYNIAPYLTPAWYLRHGIRPPGGDRYVAWYYPVPSKVIGNDTEALSQYLEYTEVPHPDTYKMYNENHTILDKAQEIHAENLQHVTEFMEQENSQHFKAMLKEYTDISLQHTLGASILASHRAESQKWKNYFDLNQQVHEDSGEKIQVRPMVRYMSALQPDGGIEDMIKKMNPITSFDDRSVIRLPSFSEFLAGVDKSLPKEFQSPSFDDGQQWEDLYKMFIAEFIHDGFAKSLGMEVNKETDHFIAQYYPKAQADAEWRLEHWLEAT